MAYEDSDYTFMIAIMHCPNRTILVLIKTHLGGGDTSDFVVPSAAIARSLSSTLVASTVLRRPHKDSDHTAMIAVVH